MSLQIGRMGLDVQQTNVSELSGGGTEFQISGRVSMPGGFFSAALREQIANLAENPHEKVYPVVYDEHPWFNGYYEVTSANVEMASAGAIAIGWFPFTIQLRRLATAAAPLLESRTLGVVRGNFDSVTTVMAWMAVPAMATGFHTSTGDDLTIEDRLCEEGKVRVYRTPQASNSGLLNAYQTFLCPPENWYDGAARIRTGLLDRISATVFTYTGGLQAFVVPDGVTKLIVEVHGAQGAGRLGGKGGRMICDLDVTPGETIYVSVGGKGGTTRGGFPDGGNGGSATFAHHGWGGGGSSDVRQGGDTRADRVVVSGGGGGMGGANPKGGSEDLGAGWRAGKGGGLAGSDAETVHGGRRGTATAGGGPGEPYPERPVGSSGSSSDAGDGASTAASNYYAGGGGGGGWFGGGGGSATNKYASAGGGGGGSGISTGENSIHSVGVRPGNGKVIITPVVTQPNIQRYTVVGDQAPNSPLGWELSNGTVKMVPVYQVGTAAFDTFLWTGSDWGTRRRWSLGDTGALTLDATATAAVILLNTPEEAAIQVTYEYTNRSDVVTATFSIRRGSTMVHCLINGPSKVYSFYTTNLSDGTEGLGRIQQTTADTFGNKWAIFSPHLVVPDSTGHSGFQLFAANTGFRVAVGFNPAWASSDISNLYRQYMANLTESVRAVIR